MLFSRYSSPPWNEFRKLTPHIPGCSLPSFSCTRKGLGHSTLLFPRDAGGTSFPHFIWSYLYQSGEIPAALPTLPPPGTDTGMEAQSFWPSSLGSLDRKKRFSSSRGSMTPEEGTTLCPAFLESQDRKQWLPLTPPLFRCSPRGAGTGGCWLCSLCSFRSFSSPSGHRSYCCRRRP